MEIARAIYKGGEIVRADDESLNYYSYINLGLRCPICGEEVHLKKGDVKKPHFAHFHKTDDSEECSLRLEANSSSSGWQNIIEGKGQRREIFQQHFLHIIASSHSGFYDIINATKENINDIEMDELTDKCIAEFKANKKRYINYCYKHEFKLTDSLDEGLTLQVVLESIDYLLTNATNKNLLRKIIIFLFGNKAINNNNLCFKAIDTLLETNWLKDIAKITNTKWYQSKQKQQLNNQSIKKEIYRQIFSSHQSDATYPQIKDYNHTNAIFIEQPVKLVVIVDGECKIDTVTVNTNSKLIKSNYQYYLGNVFLAMQSDESILKLLGKEEYKQYDKFIFIGLLTDEEFQCVVNSKIYSEIKKQVQDNFLKLIQKQKTIDKIIKKTELQSQAQSKEKLLIANLGKLNSNRVKHYSLDFIYDTHIEGDSVRTINNRKFELSKSIETSRSIKSKIFQEINIKGYEVRINPMPYKTWNHSCTIGEVNVLIFPSKEKFRFICLGVVTFDTFEFYPDVRKLLIDNCKFKLSDINKIEKDCIKAWCAVPKIKKYLDKQAKEEAKSNYRLEMFRKHNLLPPRHNKSFFDLFG